MAIGDFSFNQCRVRKLLACNSRFTFLVLALVAITDASSSLFSASRSLRFRSLSSKAAFATSPHFKNPLLLPSPNRLGPTGDGDSRRRGGRSSFPSVLCVSTNDNSFANVANAPPSTNARANSSRGPSSPNSHLSEPWAPPSQVAARQRVGAGPKVFEIQQPQDLLDFVIEDERLSVVKVYASWCMSCKVFDTRYRKLASKLGDKFDYVQRPGANMATPTPQLKERGRVRFAQMRYDDPNNKEVCELFNATNFPYIIMYKGTKGKVTEFQCLPTNFQNVIDAVNEFADPVADDGAVATPAEAATVAAGMHVSHIQ